MILEFRVSYWDREAFPICEVIEAYLRNDPKCDSTKYPRVNLSGAKSDQLAIVAEFHMLSCRRRAPASRKANLRHAAVVEARRRACVPHGDLARDEPDEVLGEVRRGRLLPVGRVKQGGRRETIL